MGIAINVVIWIYIYNSFQYEEEYPAEVLLTYPLPTTPSETFLMNVLYK